VYAGRKIPLIYRTKFSGPKIEKFAVQSRQKNAKFVESLQLQLWQYKSLAKSMFQMQNLNSVFDCSNELVEKH